MPTSDVFAPTMRTWILDRDEAGKSGRDELNRYIMEVYAPALKVYYLGTSYRSYWDADDAVSGFFVEYLGRAEYFREWQKSGMRLRRWLMNGMCWYLKSRWKAEIGRNKGAVMPDDSGLMPAGEDDTQRGEFVRAFVRAARELARQECDRRGLARQWEAFTLYYVRGLSRRLIGEQLGENDERVWVMVLTGKRHFVKAAREVLLRDGVREEDIDLDIGDLL
jgi:DNA-directed RNA polymerase specialized sigma24 family protein